MTTRPFEPPTPGMAPAGVYLSIEWGQHFALTHAFSHICLPQNFW